MEVWARKAAAQVRDIHKEYVLGTSIRRARAFCAVPVLLAAVACGSSVGSASVDPRDVGPASGTITWYAINFGPDELPQRLITAFEKEHPDITVEFQAAPNNTDTVRATLTTEISGGSGSIDVYSGDVIWPAQFGEAHLAMPLDEHLPEDFWDRFPEDRAAVTEHDGEHVAAPSTPTSASSTTARTCWSGTTCRCPRPGRSWPRRPRRSRRPGTCRTDMSPSGPTTRG